MSAGADFQFSAEDFSGRVRLFPLPHRVFFPQMVVPLRIVEARYRDLVDDALAGDRLIALAILAPGWESDYEVAWKEALLAETNVHQRAEMLLGHLAAAADDDRPGAAGILDFPPPFHVN